MNSIGLIEIGLGQFGQYTEDYMYTGNSLNNMRLIKKKLLIYKDICMYVWWAKLLKFYIWRNFSLRPADDERGREKPQSSSQHFVCVIYVTPKTRTDHA